MSFNMKKMWDSLRIYVNDDTIFRNLIEKDQCTILYFGKVFANFTFWSEDSVTFRFCSLWYPDEIRERYLIENFERNQFFFRPYIYNEQAQHELLQGIKAIQQVLTISDVLLIKIANKTPGSFTEDPVYIHIAEKCVRALEPYPALANTWHVIKCAMYDL